MTDPDQQQRLVTTLARLGLSGASATAPPSTHRERQ